MNKLYWAVFAVIVAALIYAALKSSPMGPQVGAAILTRALEAYQALPYILAALAGGFLYGLKFAGALRPKADR